MRLYSTLARDLVDLPDPPGPIGMYVCGPTVYAAGAHRQRASVCDCHLVSAGSARRGYDVTLVHNITDVNDKIYEAAPGASAERAERGDALVPRGHRPLRSRRGRPLAAGDRDDGRDHRVHRRPDRPRLRLRGRRRRLLPRLALLRSTAASPGEKPDQVEEQEPNARKEDPRDFALWKANKPEEDTCLGLALGSRPPGLAHRVLGDGREAARTCLEIHGGGLDLVFPHHENELAQSRALGHEFAKIWMHNGMLRFTGEKMSKSLGNVVTIQEALDLWGRETLLLFFLGGALAEPDRLLRRDDGSRRRRSGDVPNAFARSRRARRPPGSASPAALDDDFNTPQGPGAHPRVARAAPRLLSRGARALRSRVARQPSCGAAGDRRAGGAAAEAARAATSPRPTAFGTRSRQPVGGPRGARWLPTCPRPDPRARLRPQAGARGDSRATGGARAVGDRAGAQSRGPGCATWPRVHVKPDREIGERAETRDHQGVIAWCEPYRYADAHELAAVERPLLACLDQVTDPRNLGAVIRSAEGPARRRRRAGARLRACDAGGLPRSAGAVEHLPVAVVPDLARYLNEIKRGDLWIYAAAAEAEQDMWSADLTGGLALVFGAEGKGVRPLVRRACDAHGLDPARRERRVAQRQRRGGAPPVRGAAETRGWLTRPSTSSTATTCCTPDRSPTSAS